MGRKRKAKAALPDALMEPYVPPQEQDPVSLERLVDEGVVIATHAVTMAVKNASLVDTIRDGNDFDAEHTAELVRGELTRLAIEQREYAERVDEGLEAVRYGRPGDPEHAHDYGDHDKETLERRGEVYRTLADVLDGLRTDDAYIDSVVAAVRDSVWGEVSEAIDSRLQAQTVPHYDDVVDGLTREQRIAQLKASDLALLQATRTIAPVLPALPDYPASPPLAGARDGGASGTSAGRKPAVRARDVVVHEASDPDQAGKSSRRRRWFGLGR